MQVLEKIDEFGLYQDTIIYYCHGGSVQIYTMKRHQTINSSPKALGGGVQPAHSIALFPLSLVLFI